MLRFIGFLIALSVAMAVLQVAAKAMIIAFAALLIYALIARPGETIGCILLFIMMGVIGHYPIVGPLIFAGLLLVGLSARK